MTELNVAQMIVTAVAVLLMLTPLLMLAFLAGRRSVATGTNRRFDQIRPDVILAAGTWRAEFDGDEPGASQVVLLELQQVGSRIVGVGKSMDGTFHALEGILCQRRLCCISIAENREEVWSGTVTAELQPGEQQIIGMRNRWSRQSQTLIVRKATLTRVDPVTAELSASQTQ
jgi:hypothetical protein